MPSPAFTHDVVVIGGGGHVGLPLAVAFAEQGASVVVYDISDDAVAAGRERLAGIVEQYLGDVGEDARPDADESLAGVGAVMMGGTPGHGAEPNRGFVCATYDMAGTAAERVGGSV